MMKIGILMLVFVGLILGGIWLFNQLTTQKNSYAPDDTKDPQNPSRGYYIQIDSADKDRLEKYEETVRLSLLAYDLYPYRNTAIPEEKLQELEVFLQEAKKRNIKCIFRAAYGFDEEEVNDADSKERIASHIEQITPILNKYKSQVYCVQAGFFGPWGEWHSSRWLEDGQEGKDNRNWLLALLLEGLDEEIVINVRRPRFIRDGLEVGLSPKRIGFHNDGLLATESDYGTYDDEAYSRDQELGWLEENIQVSQNGGEMPKVTPYAGSDNALKEFPMLTISYLNLTYNVAVFESWKENQIRGQDAFSYISKRLGYRYYVSEISYPKTVRKGILSLGQKIVIILANEGFAPIEDRYVLEVIIEGQDGRPYVYETLENIGGLERGGQITLKIPVTKPKDYSYDRVGIRISEKVDLEKQPINCVELVNNQFIYKDGINYIELLDGEKPGD